MGAFARCLGGVPVAAAGGSVVLAVAACGRVHYERLSADGAAGDASADASLAASSDLRLWYAEGSGDVRERLWDDTEAVWSAPSTIEGAAAAPRWLLASRDPNAGATLLATTSDTVDRSTLTIQRDTGSGWTTEWALPTAPSSSIAYRGYAVAHEGLSGDSLVVWTEGGHGLSYRTGPGGEWGPVRTVPVNDDAGPGPDLSTFANLWVRLVPDPSSDWIALLFSNEGRELLAMMWDGNDWVTASATRLGDAIAYTGTTEPRHPVHFGFDGAFEASSGDLLVAWGRAHHDGFYFATYTGSWSAATPLVVSGHFRTQVAELGAAPGGDRVAFAGTARDGTETLALATWDGAAWVDIGTYDPQIHDVDGTQTSDTSDQPLGVGWLDADTAVCIYPDDRGETLDWVRWAPTGGWAPQDPVPVPGKSYTESVQIVRIGNALMAVLSDSDASLYAARYDGGPWLVTQAGAPLTTTLSSTTTRPFAAR